MKKILKKLLINQKSAPYYFLVPVIVVFSVFMLYPIVKSLILSFYSFKGGEYVFIGFKNYLDLAKDPVFKKSLFNTFIYLIVQVPVMVFLALLLAALVDQTFVRMKSLFRVSIFLPVVTSLVAYSLVFKLMLNNEYGLVNFVLQFLGAHGVNWLGEA